MRWIWIRLKMFISVVFFGCVILISCWIILPKTEQCLGWSFRLDLKRKTNLLWASCFIHYLSSLKQSCKVDAVMFFVYMRKQRWGWHRFYKSLLHTEPEFTSRSAWFQNPWLFIPLSQTVQTQWKQNDIWEYLGKNFTQDYEKEHSTNSLLHNLHIVISVLNHWNWQDRNKCEGAFISVSLCSVYINYRFEMLLFIFCMK